MNQQIAQLALYLVGAGLLGLALGWWLSRSSSRRTLDRAVGDWKQRLSASENELEEAADEVRRLAGQVAELNVEVETTRDESVSLASKLGESERLLAGEREGTNDLRSQIEARDAENAELASRLRQEVETLRQEQLVAQEDLGRLEDELERERGHAGELEAAAERYSRRIADLENALTGRGREDDALRGRVSALDEEVVRLRKVKLEFQEWMQGAALREEELDHARRQLDAATERIRELEAVLNGPLVDVDRMQTMRTGSRDEEAEDADATSEAYREAE